MRVQPADPDGPAMSSLQQPSVWSVLGGSMSHLLLAVSGRHSGKCPGAQVAKQIAILCSGLIVQQSC